MYYNIPILLKLSEKGWSSDKYPNFIISVRIFTFIEGLGNHLHANVTEQVPLALSFYI